VGDSTETVGALDRGASIWTRPITIWPPAIARPEWAGAWLALRAVLGSRVIVWVAGLFAIMLFGENIAAFQILDPFGVTAPFHSIPLDKLVAPGARWDSVWYLTIAGHGYFSPQSANFFPLYPLLVRLGSDLDNQPLVLGVVLSTTAMFGALTVLYRLALLDVDEPSARLTVVLVALFPTSLFMSAVYSTSLFVLVSIAAIYAARSEHWPVAGLCGGLAAATRSNGIVLLLPLTLLYLYGPRAAPVSRAPNRWWQPRFAIARSAGWLMLVPAGLAAYLGYLWVTHGAPLAPYHAAHADWGHVFAGPFGSIVSAIGAVPGDIAHLVAGSTHSVGPGDPVSYDARNLIDLGFVALAAGALFVSLRRVPVAYTAYAVAQLAVATSFPSPHEALMGFPRYALAMFPLFIGAAGWLSARPRLRDAVLVASGALLALFSGLWAYWALVP
jgi:hypothetical protein